MIVTSRRIDRFVDVVVFVIVAVAGDGHDWRAGYHRHHRGLPGSGGTFGVRAVGVPGFHRGALGSTAVNVGHSVVGFIVAELARIELSPGNELRRWNG